MAGSLREYQAKRNFRTTAEPQGAQTVGEGAPEAEQPAEPLRFVVQEHHARRLHWDFRLERDGVRVCWALPRGVPEDPRRNHLAAPGEHPAVEATRWRGGT